jgi:hypothetical protein
VVFSRESVEAARDLRAKLSIHLADRNQIGEEPVSCEIQLGVGDAMSLDSKRGVLDEIAGLLRSFQ